VSDLSSNPNSKRESRFDWTRVFPFIARVGLVITLVALLTPTNRPDHQGQPMTEKPNDKFAWDPPPLSENPAFPLWVLSGVILFILTLIALGQMV
jgi:hypothetical protein